MRAQRPQRPSLDTSFSSLSLETAQASGSAYKPQRTRADSGASHSSSSAFATPPEGHSPRHSLIPATTSTSSTATATQDDFESPFKSNDTITLTHSPRSLHTRTASVGSPPLHEFVKAKYDYVPDHPSGLPFYAGQLIQVHYKDASGWWDGEVANVRGWFPSNYLFQNSSKFVRASTQSSRRLATHRSRNASIDVVTPADRQNAQARPVARPVAQNASNTVGSNSTPHVSLRQNVGAASYSYAAERRRPSLATTDEQDEHGHEETTLASTQVRRGEQESTWNRPRPTISRSTSGQSIANSYFQSSSQGHARQHSRSQSAALTGRSPYFSSSSNAHYSQPSSSTSPTPQAQQQDWASLSISDLVALQTLLARPSPLSQLRHPDPTTPFEVELDRRFSVVSSANSLSSIGDSAGSGSSLVGSNQSRRGSNTANAGSKSGGAQFLNVVHRALWVLENAVIATSDNPFDEGGSRRGSINSISSPLDGAEDMDPSLTARDHLAPAMACVIGTVRSVLSSSDCLPRESDNLRKHPVLLGHRKVVLGELARLVSQTKRVGNRGSDDDPLSPINDEMARRGSGSSTSMTLGMTCILDASTDLEVRRELERSQAVYDGVRRFVIAAIECGIHFEEPPLGVQSLFGLVEEERDPDAESEASVMSGDGSWEEDHGFRFRVASGSITGHGRHASIQSLTKVDNALPQATEAEKYASRARRFADTRPGHSRRRTGSNASAISISQSGYGSHSSGSAGSINSGGSTNSRIRPTPAEGIEQRLQQRVGFELTPNNRLNTTGSGGARRGTDAANTGADTRAASAVAAAAAMRAAKSLGDLRARYQKNGVANAVNGAGTGAVETPRLVPASGSARLRQTSLNPELKAAHRAKVIHGRSAEPTYDGEYRPRANKSSISSVSSAESSSSNVSSSLTHSSSPPSSPGLPSGPCTILQVLQALRTTQDRILHGTAAFIGAAQYHSRSSHPASKSYLVSLTREIVDFVRRLLIIADAILGNPAVRSGRAREVELAGVYKARLYVEMNRVVDAVRELTSIRNQDSDGGSSANHGDADADDEGKGTVLKRAHLANKCAGELVLALKLCLSFRVTSAAAVSGDRGLVIFIPPEVALAASRSAEDITSGHVSTHSSANSISHTPNDTPKQRNLLPSKSSLVSQDGTPKPRLQYRRLNTNVGDAGTAPLQLNSRSRSHTTRDPYFHRAPDGSLHKKAVSMVGMNALYRAQSLRERHGLGKAPVEDEEQLIDSDRLGTSGNLADFMELDEERDEESDRERYPLLMSEQEFSDGQDDETHEDLEARMTVDYSVHKDLPLDNGSLGQSRARKSIDQVRRSLERGLTRRPSMNLLEPTTPLDGTEEVVEIDEEEVELDPRSPSSEKALPQPPVSPLPGHPPRPAHAPPPKPANHDGLVVSHNGNIVFNNEGVVVGATLQALVDRITPADTFGDTKLASYFLLTFRLFSSPTELVDAISHRFWNPIDNGPAKDDQSAQSLSESQRSHMADVVHLRVLNFVKEWIRGHWYPARDFEAHPKLVAFCKELTAGANPKVVPTAKRMLTTLEELAAGANSGQLNDIDRMRSAGRLRDQQANLPSAMGTPTTPVTSNPFTDVPRPEVNKSLMSQLKNRQYASVSLLAFSPAEMARQLTLLESRLYLNVPPEEVIESGMKGKKTPNVKALSTLSTAITGWVTDWILKEGFDVKKRIAVVKFFLKVGKECLLLCNYSTPRSMMAALESAPIRRLTSVFGGLSQKHRLVFDEMQELSDHSRNSAKYRQRLRNTVAPAVPFLGLILTDVTFTREGNGALRPSPIDSNKMLINFNRYNRLAKIMGDMIRLQQPYNLKEIAEVQQYLNYVLDPSRITADADILHNRSRLIEPRVEEDTKQGKSSDLFGWANFGSIRGNPGGAP